MKLTLDIDTAELDDMRFGGLLTLLGVVPDEPVGHVAAICEAVAPTPPTETTPTPSEEPDPELDSAGVAWDEELHASSKAKNKDGTWRKRRGVDDAPAPPPPAADLAPAPPAAAPAPPVPPAPETSHIAFTDMMKLITSAQTQGKDAQSIVTALGHQWPPMDLFPDAMGAQRDMVAAALKA